MLFIDFRIDVSVYQQEIGPPIVIEIEKHCPPSEILCVKAEAGWSRHVIERPVAIVLIESRRIVRKVSFENIEPAIAVVVSDRRSHSGLLAPVLVECRAGCYRDIGERSVAIVPIKAA